MQKEYLTERLKYLTEIFRLVWISVLAVGGGTVGLWLGPHDFWRSVFTVGGVITVVVLVGIGLRLDRAMKQVLTQLWEL
jgi:MFS family permease